MAGRADEEAQAAKESAMRLEAVDSVPRETPRRKSEPMEARGMSPLALAWALAWATIPATP